MHNPHSDVSPHAISASDDSVLMSDYQHYSLSRLHSGQNDDQNDDHSFVGNQQMGQIENYVF